MIPEFVQKIAKKRDLDPDRLNDISMEFLNTLQFLDPDEVAGVIAVVCNWVNNQMPTVVADGLSLINEVNEENEN